MAQEPVMWTRQFVAERWPNPITPLSASIMFEAFVGEFLRSEYFADKICHGVPPVAIINGYPYLNATMFLRLISHLGIPTPGFIAELYPPHLREAETALTVRKPAVRAYYTLGKTLWEKRFWRLIDLNPVRNHIHWDRFVPEYLDRIDQLEATRITNDSTAALASKLRKCVDLLWEYRRIHLGSLALGNILYQFLGFLTDHWAAPFEVVRRGHLVSGLRGSKTLETNRALWELAQTIGADPSYCQLFKTAAQSSIIQTLNQEPEDHPIRAAFERFLQAFGHRTGNSYELLSPTWKKDPSFIIKLIREFLETETYPLSLRNEEAKVRSRESATHRVNDLLTSRFPHRIFPYRKLMFKSLLGLSQKYMLLRENQRFIFDYNLEALKLIIDEIGIRFQRQGFLDAQTHIYFMPLEVIMKALAGTEMTPTIGQIARQNVVLHQQYETVTPPVYVQGDAPDEWSVLAEPEPLSMLAGTGVSSGKVTGKVRIIMDPQGIERLHDDEILVTIGTDPGWTPLFLTAVGAIMEIGGMLSHGSVVAREYGLPAVVGIVGATKILRNGQIITIDGDNGVVYI